MRFSYRFCVAALAGLMVQTVHCSLGSLDVETVNRIIRGVSAVDHEWYGVLTLDVRVNRDGLNESVTRMLDDDLQLTAAGDLVRVQRVVSYLATHGKSSTKQQIRFGADLLGKAVSCQFAYTLVMHSFIALQYSKRKSVKIADVRSNLSRIQVAMAAYIDKLAFFDQDAGHYLRANRMINELFALHDRDPDVKKKEFVACLFNLNGLFKERSADGCAYTKEEDIAELVKIVSYDKRIMTEERARLENHHVTTMINNLDQYEFITFTSRSPEFWMKTLEINAYELKSDKELTLSAANDDDF